MLSFCFGVWFQEIGAEISELVKQRDHLEAELKKVPLRCFYIFQIIICGCLEYDISILLGRRSHHLYSNNNTNFMTSFPTCLHSEFTNVTKCFAI